VNAVEEKSMADPGVGRLQKAVADGRKDGLLIDCARLVGVHYGKMVEHFSAAEGSPISGHNNKTLFLEGLDYWCRSLFTGQAGRVGTTEDAKEMILRVMEPWYEAMELDDPSQYKMGRRAPLPVYVGSPEDVIAVELGLAACLDVGPTVLRYGLDGDVARRVWGRVKADGKWYDTDPTEAGFSLGNYVEYPKYMDVEVPL
jgi:hypothetical protein